MKNIFLFVLGAVPLASLAQDTKYTVEGKVGNYNLPAKIYLQYRVKDKAVTDSVVLVNGQFKFSGLAEASPKNAYLILNDKGTGPSYADYKSVYLEKGTIAVNSKDSLKNATVTGTKTNIDNTAYEAAIKPIYSAYDSLENASKSVPAEQQQTPEYQKLNNRAEKNIEKREAAVNRKFITEHPDSYVALMTLESYAYSADYVDIAPLYNNLSQTVKQTEAGVKFGERLPLLKGVALGATAPEFTEADTSGKTVDLNSFRGKYVLIDFWASWCGPCRHENPNVVKAFNKYKGKNFTIIGVSLDRPGKKDKWLEAIHKDGLNWTQVSDLKFWDSKTAALYAVRGIPQNFLLDPNGKIIAKNLRGDDLDEKLAELFPKI